jgi:hypothetical protein
MTSPTPVGQPEAIVGEDYSMVTWEQVLFTVTGKGFDLHAVLKTVETPDTGPLRMSAGGATPGSAQTDGQSGGTGYSYHAWDKWYIAVDWDKSASNNWDQAIKDTDPLITQLATGRLVLLDVTKLEEAKPVVDQYVRWLDTNYNTLQQWVNKLTSDDSAFKGKAAHAIQDKLKTMAFTVKDLYEQIVTDRNTSKSLQDTADAVNTFAKGMAQLWLDNVNSLRYLVNNLTVAVINNVDTYIRGKGLVNGTPNYVLDHYAKQSRETAENYIKNVIAGYSSTAHTSPKVTSNTTWTYYSGNYTGAGTWKANTTVTDDPDGYTFTPGELPDKFPELSGPLDSGATWNSFNTAVATYARTKLEPLDTEARKLIAALETAYARTKDPLEELDTPAPLPTGGGGNQPPPFGNQPPPYGNQPPPNGGGGPDLNEFLKNLYENPPGGNSNGPPENDFSNLFNDPPGGGGGPGGGDSNGPPTNDLNSLLNDPSGGGGPGGGDSNGPPTNDLNSLLNEPPAGSSESNGPPGGNDFNGPGGNSPNDFQSANGGPGGTGAVPPPFIPPGSFSTSNGAPESNRRLPGDQTQFDENGNPINSFEDDGWEPPPNGDSGPLPSSTSNFNPADLGLGSNNLPDGSKDFTVDSSNSPPGGSSNVPGFGDFPGGSSNLPGGSSNLPGFGDGPGGSSNLPGGSSNLPGFGDGPGGSSNLPGGSSNFPGGSSNFPGGEFSNLPGGGGAGGGAPGAFGGASPGGGGAGAGGFGGEGWSDWSGQNPAEETDKSGFNISDPSQRGGMPPMMPPMMPMNGGQGGDKERERQTWLSEDDKIWGTDSLAGNGVIGLPNDRAHDADEPLAPTHVHVRTNTPRTKAGDGQTKETEQTATSQ